MIARAVPIVTLLSDSDESTIVTRGNSERSSQILALQVAVVATLINRRPRRVIIRNFNNPILRIMVVSSSITSRSNRVVCWFDSHIFEIITKP
jgi:hypothetical protein